MGRTERFPGVGLTHTMRICAHFTEFICICQKFGIRRYKLTPICASRTNYLLEKAYKEIVFKVFLEQQNKIFLCTRLGTILLSN